MISVTSVTSDCAAAVCVPCSFLNEFIMTFMFLFLVNMMTARWAVNTAAVGPLVTLFRLPVTSAYQQQSSLQEEGLQAAAGMQVAGCALLAPLRQSSPTSNSTRSILAESSQKVCVA